MREHGTHALLHERHRTVRPMMGEGLPVQEVIREQSANHAAEIMIERDQQGRIVKKATKELQRVYLDLFGNGYRLSDLSPEQQSITIERFEYAPDTGHMTKSIEEKFNPVSPETPYFTRIIEYTYADNGGIAEQRVEFKGFNDAQSLTYSSRVTKWEKDKAVEFKIEDRRSKERTENIKRVRTYDDAGRVATEVDFVLGPEDEESEKEAYTMTYDEEGRLLEVQQRRAGETSTWRYEYEERPEGQHEVTRRSFDEKGREGMGERMILGPNEEKLRYESWFAPDAQSADTTWVTQR